MTNRFRILRPREQQDSIGRRLTITPDMIESIVRGFNATFSSFKPPVIRQHLDGDDHDRPEAEGQVVELTIAKDGSLVAVLDNLLPSFFMGMNSDGDLASYLSPRILPPGHPNNAYPQEWALSHLARVPIPADPTLTINPIGEVDEHVEILLGMNTARSAAYIKQLSLQTRGVAIGAPDTTGGVNLSINPDDFAALREQRESAWMR